MLTTLSKLAKKSLIVAFVALIESAFLFASPSVAITYDGNGHSLGSVPVDSHRYSAGQTVKVLPNSGKLGKTGYELVYWSTKADGSGERYEAGQALVMPGKNVILYAQWRRTAAQKSTTTRITESDRQGRSM